MCMRACKGFLFPLRRLVFLSWLLCFCFFSYHVIVCLVVNMSAALKDWRCHHHRQQQLLLQLSNGP